MGQPHVIPENLEAQRSPRPILATWLILLTGLIPGFAGRPTVADGAVRFEVAAVDAAGNASPGVPVTLELDCTPPTVEVASWDGDLLVTARFSEPPAAATVALGSSVLVTGPSGPLTASLDLDGSDLVITLATAPDVSDLPLTLEITAAVTDVAGNAAIAYRRLFASPTGATLVAGEVLSSTSSLT